MKINTNPFINSVAPGKSDGGVSSVSRVSTSGLDQKSFQDQYTQTKNNLGQINPSKDHNKSASKQLQLLTQKDPTFPPLDQLVLLKDHKPQNAILLTGRIVQHLNPKVWDTFTSSEKLQITSGYLEPKQANNLMTLKQDQEDYSPSLAMSIRICRRELHFI